MRTPFCLDCDVSNNCPWPKACIHSDNLPKNTTRKLLRERVYQLLYDRTQAEITKLSRDLRERAALINKLAKEQRETKLLLSTLHITSKELKGCKP
jgi:hypothetical protein